MELLRLVPTNSATANFTHMNYTSFIPPHGTTVTHVMNAAERRRAGRLAYAASAIFELQTLTKACGIKKFQASGHGKRYTLSMTSDTAYVSFSNVAPPWVLPLQSKLEGKCTLQSWLGCQDPTFVARLIKNGYKQIRDQKSKLGKP